MRLADEVLARLDEVIPSEESVEDEDGSESLYGLGSDLDSLEGMEDSDEEEYVEIGDVESLFEDDSRKKRSQKKK